VNLKQQLYLVIRARIAKNLNEQGLTHWHSQKFSLGEAENEKFLWRFLMTFSVT